MAKKKKKVDGKEIAGRFITLFFVLLLIGGIYYLWTLFKNIEINSKNIAGTWKLSVAGSPDTYYSFKMDKEDPMAGTALSYTRTGNSAEQNDKKYYSYVMVTNDNDIIELQLQPYKESTLKHRDGDIIVIKVTGLSRAQMYVTINRNNMTAMTKVDLF